MYDGYNDPTSRGPEDEPPDPSFDDWMVTEPVDSIVSGPVQCTNASTSGCPPSATIYVVEGKPYCIHCVLEYAGRYIDLSTS